MGESLLHGLPLVGIYIYIYIYINQKMGFEIITYNLFYLFF